MPSSWDNRSSVCTASYVVECMNTKGSVDGTGTRAQTPGALAASEARMHALLEAAVDGIISIDDRGSRTGLRPCDISVEVFQSERKLVTVEPFRSWSELRALQTLNDQPETLDLDPCLHKFGSVTRCLRDQLAHQPMQRIGVGGERGEIEIHAGEFNAGAQQHPPQSLS